MVAGGGGCEEMMMGGVWVLLWVASGVMGKKTKEKEADGCDDGGLGLEGVRARCCQHVAIKEDVVAVNEG
jgi:hypothetical protein